MDASLEVDLFLQAEHLDYAWLALQVVLEAPEFE